MLDSRIIAKPYLEGYVRGNASLSLPCGASTDLGLTPQADRGRLSANRAARVNVSIFMEAIIEVLNG